ncbi:MAG: adenylate/guanylate cyclase domain-containing protein [Bacteroidota bacterium]
MTQLLQVRIKVGIAMLLLAVFSNVSFAQQNDIATLEKAYKQQYGIEKLQSLNQLTRYFRKENPRKSIKYGKLAVELGEAIFTESNTLISEEEQQLLAVAHLQLGQVMLDRERFFEAKNHFESCLAVSQEIASETYETKARASLDSLYAVADSSEIKQGLLSKTFGQIRFAKNFNKTANNLGVQKEMKLAIHHENRGNFIKAIEHYEQVINLLQNQGSSEDIGEIQLKIAQIYDSLNQHSTAQKFLGEAIANRERELVNKNGNVQTDNTDLLDSLATNNATKVEIDKVLRDEQAQMKNLAERYARENDYESSIAYYRMYQELTVKIRKDSLDEVAARQQKENEIALLKQQKKIADMNVQSAEREKERQVEIRNASIGIGVVLTLGALGLFYLYLTKRKQHKRLEVTHRDLNKAKTKLVSAEKRIVKLLTQQVSEDIALELLQNTNDVPGKHFVCLMFLDIRDFTPLAEKMTPEELIDYQNNVFGFMMDTIQSHNGNINQLMGDGLMATFGAPKSHGNDCQNAYKAAQEILFELKEHNDAGVIKKTKIGIGLHAGYVVTGNVGNEKRKQYSVTGNPVIIASRVEQLNKEHQSQLIITEEVYQKLENPPSKPEAFLEAKLKGRSKPVKILKVV